MASCAPKPNYEFRLEWMNNFKWSSPVKDDKSKAYCALCKLPLNISHNGKFALVQHEKTMKHLRTLSKINGEYRHNANNNASTLKPLLFEPTTVECPDSSAGINSGKSARMEIMNDPSVKTVSLINPPAPFHIRNADKSEDLLLMQTDFSILPKTNLTNHNSKVDERSNALQNRNSMVDERSNSLQNTSETLDSVRNTHKSNNGSRSDVPEINGCLGNNSKLTLSDAPKDSFPELLDITSRATVSSLHREQSVCPVYNNLSDVNVKLEPIQTGAEIDKPSSHLSTPSPSKAMEQAVEIYSNHPNSPSTLTGAEMTLEETLEIHSCEDGDTESFLKEESYWEEDDISLRLSEHSNNTQRSEIDESSLSKRRCLPTRELPGPSHSITRDKSHILEEIHCVFKRLDEAKLVYENKCRIIMEDYKILLNKLSEKSDPTFSMPEHVSSWNSLKLLRMLYNEARISDGQRENGSNSQENLSTSQGLLNNVQIRKRKAKDQVQHSQ